MSKLVRLGLELDGFIGFILLMSSYHRYSVNDDQVYKQANKDVNNTIYDEERKLAKTVGGSLGRDPIMAQTSSLIWWR